MNKAYSAYDLK